MLKETVSLDEVLDLLNSAIASDGEAMRALVESRVPCNQALADHPSIQTGISHVEGQYTVGLLGILNGIFGVDELQRGYIAALFDVVCPNGHETPSGVSVGDVCSECSSKLEMGKLVKFLRAS